jgi:hypothetical protein
LRRFQIKEHGYPALIAGILLLATAGNVAAASAVVTYGVTLAKNFTAGNAVTGKTSQEPNKE